jgi:tetratricopeptide (TPR) repeat protein
MRVKLIFLLLFPLVVFAQNSEKYEHTNALFFKAEDLFLKQQYSAAREGFVRYLREPGDKMPSFIVKARYYEAVAALELQHDDAMRLLMLFLEDYPESKYRWDIYFRIARQHFNRNQFKDVIEWFEKIPLTEVSKSEQAEYNFKLGYSYFKEEDYAKAKKHFVAVKDSDSQYAPPATYYFAHICYTEKQFDTALEHFKKIQNTPGFDKLVPYYIAQIHHARGEYNKVIEIAPALLEKSSDKNQAELNQIIGDSYYRLGDYEKAVPYLLAYNKGANTTREDDYQLGFALMKTGNCAQAVKFFEKVGRKNDELGQAALYHTGGCYLAANNLMSARAAFEQASKMNFDPKIEEDALFQTAILSYELNLNPFDEAIKYFELYIEKYPTSYRRRVVYEYLVNVYMSTKNYDKAMQSIEKLDPPSTRMKTAYQFLAFNKGIESYTNGQFNDAIEAFQLVAKYPMDNDLVAQSRYWMADSRYQLKQYASAISAYQFFLSNSNNTNHRALRAEANYNMGYAYFNSDQFAQAIPAFKAFIDLAPVDAKRKVSDANLRIADCYYKTSVKNESASLEAIAYYQRVIDAKQGMEDRALYYQARCYGFVKQRDKQITALNKLMNEYPQSSYLVKSIFEAGIVRRNQGNYSQSNAFFERILSEFPNNVVVKDAIYELGVNHLRMNNLSKAEEYFMRLLKDYSKDETMCKYAGTQLSEVYKKAGTPEKINQLQVKYPCTGITQGYQDTVYFDAAYQLYIDSNFNQALVKFKEYLSAYPNGIQKDRANFLIAESYFSLGQISNAYGYYLKVINGSSTAYHEVALLKAANFEYENQQYADAIKNYGKLAEIASNPYRVFGAHLGLMRCHYLLENWSASLQAANFVNGSTLSQASEKMEARFCKGISLKMIGQYADAIPDLDHVAKNAKNQMAVQAKFNIAEIYFLQNDYKRSEEQIRELLKMKPSYDYWTAKAILLQAKNFMKTGDLFQAESALNSVSNNYMNQTDGILSEAAQIRAELETLKNAPKNIQDNTRFIEIND